MSDLASYELDGPIATITMDDGKVNAFSIDMLKAVHSALDRAEQDGAVVVLTGREGYFSAGFDLKVFSSETPIGWSRCCGSGPRSPSACSRSRGPW